MSTLYWNFWIVVVDFESHAVKPFVAQSGGGIQTYMNLCSLSRYSHESHLEIVMY